MSLAARCVRVIHAQCVLQFALLSRTLLRSSSNNEPSDPPYRIIFLIIHIYMNSIYRFDSSSMTNNKDFVEWKGLAGGDVRAHMNVHGASTQLTCNGATQDKSLCEVRRGEGRLLSCLKTADMNNPNRNAR